MDVMTYLAELANKYGTDKGKSGYDATYHKLFSSRRHDVKTILEIGIGTLNPTISNTFFGNLQHFPDYKPGGSLRMWRDFFPNANVYGVDIAKDCMFQEDRIITMLFDSSSKDACDYFLNNVKFDIIIDDGNHDPEYQIRTLKNLFDRVVDGGFYVIEDVGGCGYAKTIFEDFKAEFDSITRNYIVTNLGNHIVIEKRSVQMFNNSDLTVVTGLWDINRPGRDFSHYLENFKKFLAIPCRMFIYIPMEYEEFIWEHRTRENTIVKHYSLENVKNIYAPFWDRTQNIRLDPSWYNITGEQGWLKSSPQAVLEWYNPIVQSKMFLLNDVTIWNPFNTKYFVWLDAGITNTVNQNYLTERSSLDKINKYLDSFLFLSYPYEASAEIHGFDFAAMNRYSGKKVQYVCRGGLFGGTKEAINQANATYYSLLDRTLSDGYMGTEESVFTIMSYLEPEKYRRYSLDSNGLIVKFVQALLDDKVVLEPVPQDVNIYTPRKHVDPNKLKLSVYMLTFNFPQQVEHTIQTWLKHPKWLTNTRNILIDNSTNEDARLANADLCKKYNFEHIINNKNLGINGGRFQSAQHFQESDSDYYVFLEDDMGLHPAVNNFCRNGFRTYVPNLYDKVLKIIGGDTNVDFLKFSYSEVYMDNNIQVSWYNVPKNVRSDVWPNYNKLPISGLDPNCPRTKFDTIEVVEGLSYIKGEVYYANWPMIVGKEGNKKMFLDTTWSYPYEQTWMSYMFQETRKGNLKPAVLLASPIHHNRIVYYKPEERKENAG